MSERSIIFLSLLTFLCICNRTVSYRPYYINTFSNPTLFIGSIKTTDIELNQICSQTQDPSFCLDAFKHDHGTPSADDNQLCAIGLRLAVFVSSNGQSQAQNYAHTEKDPQLKAKYQLCASNYDAILGKFSDAGKSLKSGKFDDVKSAASEAYRDATDCSELFGAETVVGESIAASLRRSLRLWWPLPIS
ncbi:hypothetical protein QQ045_002333 [Rhodiola kirilowii]